MAGFLARAIGAYFYSGISREVFFLKKFAQAVRASEVQKKMHPRRLMINLLWLILPIQAAAATTGTLRLATLEWRPYVASTLPGNGLTATIVASTAAQLDMSAKFDYFPWLRAMKLGINDGLYAGYFPAYYTEDRLATCHFSASIGTSTIGLAYLKTAPVEWAALDDLRKVRIGVVLGFSNGKQFDSMVASKELNVEVSGTDLQNVKKLVAGRFPAIVIDRMVLEYLLRTEPGLIAMQKRIVFHAKPLAELAMHVCFKRTESARQLQLAFDKALLRVDQQRIETDYFDRLKPAVR